MIRCWSYNTYREAGSVIVISLLVITCDIWGYGTMANKNALKFRAYLSAHTTANIALLVMAIVEAAEHTYKGHYDGSLLDFHVAALMWTIFAYPFYFWCWR